MTGGKGSIIITVVIIITVLSLISISFFYTSKTEYSSNEIFETKKKCKLAVQSAVNLIDEQLKKDYTPSYDGKDDFWTKKNFFFVYDDVNLNIFIEDEDSKINLNDLFYGSEDINVTLENQIRNFFDFKRVNPDLINSLIENYPEDSIRTLSEILSFKGFKDLFRMDTIEDSGNFFSYFTVYGDNKYNINTVDLQILKSLTDGLTDIEIDAINDFRTKYGFKKVTDLKDIYELSEENYQLIDGYLKVKSDILRINITASSGGVNYRMIQVINKNTWPVKLLFRVIL